MKEKSEQWPERNSSKFFQENRKTTNGNELTKGHGQELAWLQQPADKP
jgi:hypothetical protein